MQHALAAREDFEREIDATILRARAPPTPYIARSPLLAGLYFFFDGGLPFVGGGGAAGGTTITAGASVFPSARRKSHPSAPSGTKPPSGRTSLTFLPVSRTLRRSALASLST